MTSKNPTLAEVTIGMPVFNGAQWVERAIESLVMQDYDNIKIIISDDSSDDGTQNICKKYSDNYNNIEFSINEENLGGFFNLKKILNQCESEYFVWASQDDYWEPDFVSTLVSKLEENKDLVLASGNIELIRLDGSSIVMDFLGYWNPERLNQYLLILALLLPVSFGYFLKTNLFIHGVVRTSVLKKCFESVIGVPGHDRIYILFSILQGRWGYVDKLLYHRRVGTGTLLRDSKDIDLVRIQQESPFVPLINAWQMCFGIFKIENSNLFLKVYSLLVVFPYVLSVYMQKIRAFIVQSVLKRILPIKLYNGMRGIWRQLRSNWNSNQL